MEAGDVMLGCAASGGPWWMGQHLVTFAGPRLRMLEATYPCPPATKPCSWAHLGILEPLGPNLLWEEGSRDGNWKMVKKAGKWKRTADLHLVQRPQLALCLPLGNGQRPHIYPAGRKEWFQWSVIPATASLYSQKINQGDGPILPTPAHVCRAELPFCVSVRTSRTAGRGDHRGHSGLGARRCNNPAGFIFEPGTDRKPQERTEEGEVGLPQLGLSHPKWHRAPGRPRTAHQTGFFLWDSLFFTC
ncbi:uncharacterized protein [Petaurus breviceps papuanus]|uniref:uncharacterized protein isoform X2 n=1 Tax=Petaurus breviceps papuanus TaxID=3040969 RepID=UPI0036DABA5C